MKNRLSTLMPCGRRRISLSRCSLMVRRIIARLSGSRRPRRHGLARAQAVLAARHAQLQELLALCSRCSADAAVGVDRAPGDLLEIVAVAAR